MLKDGEIILMGDVLKTAAQSWNLKLFEDVSKQSVLSAKKEGAEIAPDFSVATDVYGSGITEDFYLSEALGKAYANGAKVAEDSLITNNEMSGATVDGTDGGTNNSTAAGNSPISNNEMNGILERAYDESIVLMKNSLKTLPLKPQTKLAVIGFEAAESFAKALSEKPKPPFKLAGCAQGYTLSGERNDSLLEIACSLAHASDAVLLFLEPDGANYKLGASCLALLDALSTIKAKVIGVIARDTDMSFDKTCHALIHFQNGFDSLIKILSGEINPSGKLCRAFYDNTAERFDELKKSLELNKIKEGFFGYRYYDTAGEKVKYPFGHGLSYSEFSYSKIKADAKEISFVVKNKGKRGGWETAQVYIGKKESNAVRPLKELKGFGKFYLNAGESKLIRINLKQEALAFCDALGGEGRAEGDKAEGGAYVGKVEGGTYTAYVGRSVSDIRLKKDFEVDGGSFAKTKEKLSDYILAKSNIESGKYTVSAKLKISREALISLVVMFVTGAYDISFALFFNTSTVAAIILIALNIFAVAAVLTLILTFRRRITVERLKAQTPFENETALAGDPALEKLFLDEFNENKNKPKESDDEDMQNIDESLTVKAALDAFLAYCGARGFALSPLSAKEIFSALAASQSIAVSNADDSLTQQFIGLLSTYFPPPFFINNENDFNKNAIALNLKFSKTDPKTAPDSTEPKSESAALSSLSYHQFLSLIENAEKTYWLNESLFKGFDKIADGTGGFGNKRWRAIERYTSVYLACGGEAEDAAASATELLLKVKEA